MFTVAALLSWGVGGNNGTGQSKAPDAVARDVPPPGLADLRRQNDSLLSNDTLVKAIRQRRIVNAHEHIQSKRQAAKLVEAMNYYGVDKTLLAGSGWFTITLNPADGFTRYDENNAALIEIQKAYPGRFDPWPTIDPLDPEKLKKIQRLVARGAVGVKLYLGHGFVNPLTKGYFFHSMALDDPRMLPFYAWCEENFVPLMIHVNPYKPGFAEEFISMLTRFPNLKVIAPHFILSSIRDSRLQEFLDTFPNLYSDISFGSEPNLIAGLKRISRNPEKFRKLFEKYPDRFMFGTDLVITSKKTKTAAWMETRMRAYLSMLATSSYRVAFIPEKSLNGLNLSGPILEGILYRNYEAFMKLRPRGTRITREIDWSRMGVEKTR